MTQPDPQSEKPEIDAPTTHSVRRRIVLALSITGGIVAIWMLGDLIYSRVVLRQLDEYERSLSWDPHGVRTGEDAFDVGDGPTAILMVHGINFSPIAFRNLGPELAEHGFKCRAMRLPGFGRPVRDYANYATADWIDAVDREVRDLADRHEQVFVVAHSLGAAVVLRYVLERRPNLDGLVLVAPAIEVSNVRSPAFPTRFWHEFSKRTLVFTNIVLSPFEYDVRDPDVLPTIPRKQFTPRAIVDQTFAMIDQNRGQASQIDIPLLMLLSPTDQVISTPAAQAYFEQWGSGLKFLQMQPDSGHMIPLDYGWRNAAAAIIRFVAVATDDS